MFEIIDDILIQKTGKSLERNDFSDEFNLYMIQRWISMHSDINVEILNSSINIVYKALDDEQYFKLMQQILPTTSTNGKYIKVISKKNKKKRDEIDISQTFEESFIKIEESLALVLGDNKNNG